jgi:hypothetical protein
MGALRSIDRLCFFHAPRGVQFVNVRCLIQWRTKKHCIISQSRMAGRELALIVDQSFGESS